MKRSALLLYFILNRGLTFEKPEREAYMVLIDRFMLDRSVDTCTFLNFGPEGDYRVVKS